MSDLQIADTLLVPGDIIRFDFLEKSANDTIRALAIAKIKDTISSDDRLDYQGSEWTEPVDLDTGQAYRMLSVYAKVRKYRRGMRTGTQEASIGSIAAAVLVGAVVGAIAVWSANIGYKTYAIVRVTENPNLSAEEKQAAIAAIQSTSSSLLDRLRDAGTGAVLVGLALAAWVFTRPGRSKSD
jgi:hypothetical protein